MIVTIVHIWVKPEHVSAFIDATRINHQHSIQEPGNLRFDFLQEEADPTKFTLYEAYKTEADVAAHKETAHYHHWRDLVQDWMAQPRQGIRHSVVAPTALDLW
jgi:autoinducer 2-degrading protein